MCLAIPGKVLEIVEGKGSVEFGGTVRIVDVRLMEDVSVGDYVIVHAGFAIQKLDEEEAGETLRLLQGILDTQNAAG